MSGCGGIGDGGRGLILSSNEWGLLLKDSLQGEEECKSFPLKAGSCLAGRENAHNKMT